MNQLCGFAASRSPGPGEVVRTHGEGGHVQEELRGEGDSELEDCEDVPSSESQEARRPKILNAPSQPSRAELDAHRLIHVPFRAWCRECVLGRGRDRYHRRIMDSDDVARIAMDYLFLTEHGFFKTQSDAEAAIDQAGGPVRNCITVLVIKDFKHKSIWAYPVEGKGISAAE